MSATRGGPTRASVTARAVRRTICVNPPKSDTAKSTRAILRARGRADVMRKSHESWNAKNAVSAWRRPKCHSVPKSLWSPRASA
ncbi:hypothetical protein D3C83_128560 [compost metagenome]